VFEGCRLARIVNVYCLPIVSGSTILTVNSVPIFKCGRSTSLVKLY